MPAFSFSKKLASPRLIKEKLDETIVGQEEAKKADVPVFSFQYGAYTEKELMEMSGGKLKEYFDFEREWEIQKKQRNFFARKSAEEREKMRLWSLMKR